MAESYDISVARGAGYRDDGFDFVDTLGEAINNEQFSQGWLNFKDGKDSGDAYVWAALSACGDQIADTVYQNVRNYVDLAANVETCKVKALVSMLREFGLDFMLGQDFDSMPVELLNMLDAYSVDRKYLFASGVLSPSTVRRVLDSCGATLWSNLGRPEYWNVSATWENLSAVLAEVGVLSVEGWEGLSAYLPDRWDQGSGWDAISDTLSNDYDITEDEWSEISAVLSGYRTWLSAEPEPDGAKYVV